MGHTDEPPWSPPQAIAFRDSLAAHGVPVELVSYRAVPETMLAPSALADALTRTMAWLERWVR